MLGELAQALQQPVGDDPFVAAPEGRVLAGFGAAGDVGHGAQQAHQGGEGVGTVDGGAAGEHDAHAVRGAVAGGGLQHGGAAGAGGTAQQDEPAGAGAGTGRLGGDQLAHVPALGQRSGHVRLLSVNGSPDSLGKLREDPRRTAGTRAELPEI